MIQTKQPDNLALPLSENNCSIAGELRGAFCTTAVREILYSSAFRASLFLLPYYADIYNSS